MPHAIDRAGISSSEVILTCIADEPTRLAIFSNDDQFLSVMERMPDEQQEILWRNRELGRKALEDDGKEVVGAGTERIVVGFINDDNEPVVHKYAVNSLDPRGDLDVEINDYSICQRHLGGFVVKTEFEVVKLGASEVLRETQPWLDIKPATAVKRPNDKLDDQLERIYERAEILPKLCGLNIDASAIVADKSDNARIIETSLVLPEEAYVKDLAPTPQIAKITRRERSWRSLGLVATA